MDIVISKDYNETFVKVYLIEYIHDMILDLFDSDKVINLDNEFNIDSEKVFEKVADNLVVNETPSSYKISINKNIKFNGTNLLRLVNLITYGSRSCRGYTLILDLFRYIKDHLDILYKRWLDGD